MIDEEVGYILDLGVEFRPGERIDSLKALLAEGYDAVFVGSGAPRGRDLDIPGRKEAAANIHIGIDWLSSVSFGHITKIGRRVIVLGGGNTAMDCCRSSRRLGGEEVKVIVRSGFEEMKASPWEKEDAMHEGIPILNFLVPKAFTHDNGRLTGMMFEKVAAEYDAKGRRNAGARPASPTSTSPATTCWSRSARRTPSPGSSATSASSSTSGTCRRSTRGPCGSTNPKVFFGGDAAFGPKNIIWAVAHGHEAAISIDKLLLRRGRRRPPAAGGRGGQPEDGHPRVELRQRHLRRPALPGAAARQGDGARGHQGEVELGFDDRLALKEAQRCLNCDVQTVFTASLCIECDACVDICPMDCITFTANGDEAELRTRLKAPALNLTQDLYVADGLKTGRIMVKDEDVCLHCGLCAERCPTGAWDMQKFPDRNDPRGSTTCRNTKPNRQRQRLRRQVRQRQRLRLGQRQRAVRPVDPAHGRAGVGAQHLPLQHPGPADLVRGAGLRGRPSRRGAAAST